MEYWNDLVAEKSWQTLQNLALKRLKYTVIGGWAAYLWTNQHKSKDVDIVLESVAELDALKNEPNLSKNDSLRKYEIRYGEIDVDVYVPYYSRLPIPPQDIHRYSTMLKGFKTANPEPLTILKQGAEENRQNTVKGLKDRVDIMTLLTYTDFDYGCYMKLAKEYGHPQYPKRLQEIVSTFTGHQYLNQNLQENKKNKKRILEKIKHTAL